MPPPLVRSNLTWYLCDLWSGKILTDLPIEATGTITCALFQADSSTLNLLIADKTCPPDWASLLVPGIPRMLVCVVDGYPAQAWWVTGTKRGRSQTDKVPLSLTTLDAAIATVNVPDLDASDGGDPVLVAAALATTAPIVSADSGDYPLAPLTTRFGFTLEATPSGSSTEVTYASTDNTNVLAAWEDLRTADLIEYRILVRWADSTHTAFKKIIQIAARMGSTKLDAILDLDANGFGTVADYTVDSTSTPGTTGATVVVGASDGVGTGRTMGVPQIASDLLAQGWPLVEERSTYTDLADSDDVEAAVTERAAATLAAHRLGVMTYAFVAHAGTPKPGNEWDLGDTVPFDLSPSLGDPMGGAGMVRLIGFDLDLTTGYFHPRVWQDPDDN